MPTYEYLCGKCGHSFDKYQPIAAQPLIVCDKELCGQKKWGKGPVKRVIGAGGGLIFKGSGFYITDYRSDKYKEAAKKDSSTSNSSAASTSSESKSERKPAGESKPSASPAVKSETKPAKSKSSEK